MLIRRCAKKLIKMKIRGDAVITIDLSAFSAPKT